MGPPFMARRCVSKQVGRHDAACQGCPRCVSRSPEACFRVVARTVRFFPNCGVVRVAGYSVVLECIFTSEFFQRAPKGALRPFSVAALLHYFSWCASEYSVVGRTICHSSHDSIQTNVCQWPFAEIFHLLIPLLNRIDSISNLYIFT